VGRKAFINWENTSVEEIATAKNCAPKKEGFIRYQALELLLGGYSQEEVARISGRHVRTIRRWIGEFNRQGLDGLALRGSSGRPRKIEVEKFGAEYVPVMLEPERAGEEHWTALKFHGYLTEEFREELGYSTLLRYLAEHDIALRCPRSWPERQDEEKRHAFCEKLRELASDESNSLWFCDESGFEGDPRPRRTWVRKARSPRYLTSVITSAIAS